MQVLVGVSQQARVCEVSRLHLLFAAPSGGSPSVLVLHSTQGMWPCGGLVHCHCHWLVRTFALRLDSMYLLPEEYTGLLQDSVCHQLPFMVFVYTIQT